MPNKVILQNFYRTTVTSASAIPLSGDFNFDVAVAPVNKNGFLILGSENISTRQIFYYHDVIGNTIYVRGVNRITAASIPVPTGYSVKMNDVSEIFNYFGDNLSTLFYVEKIGGLSVKVSGGYIMYNNNQISVADTTLALTDGTTNYIKYDAPTNTISADTVASGNIKCEVVCSGGAITSILYRTSKESYLDFAISITGALPSQGGNSGKALVTDGTNVSWGIPNGLRSGMLTAQNIGATNGSPNITVADTTGWVNGATITGTGITGGTTISSFVPNTSAILSASFTGTTGTVSVQVGYKQLSEYDASGAEVKRPISAGTAIIGTDLIQKINPVTRAREEVPYSMIQADISLASQPIGSVRDTTVAGSFGVGYQLMQTQAMVNTDIFTSKTAMGTARQGASAGVIGTKMYVVGGDNSVSGALTTNEEYDFSLNTWSTKAVLPAGRTNAYHGVVNGKFYIIGGSSDISVTNAYQNVTYEYDPVGNSWATKTNMGTSQGDGASAVYNGRVYIIGGQNNAAALLDTVQYYDVAGNTFITGLAVIPGGRRRCSNQGVAIGSKIYVCGGIDSGSSTATSEYNAIANTWAVKAVMPVTIYGGHVEALTIDGEVRVVSVSGFNGGANVSNVYEFSPSGNSWASRSTSAPARRSSAIVAYNNEIYYVGGFTTGIVATHDKYTPYKNRYTYERIS